VSTNIIALQAGTYIFRLTVTDDDGATHTDDVLIEVLPVPNVPPVASAGSNITVTLPANYAILTATASTDSDGSIVSYLWQQVSGPLGATIENANVITTTVTGLQEGTYVFRLTVTDNDGATGITSFQIVVQRAVTTAVNEVIRTRRHYGVSNIKNGVFY